MQTLLRKSIGRIRTRDSVLSLIGQNAIADASDIPPLAVGNRHRTRLTMSWAPAPER